MWKSLGGYTMARSHFCVMILILSLGCFGLCQRGFAQGFSNTDGNMLLSRCKIHIKGMDNGPRSLSQDEQVLAAYCIGYVTGVFDDHFWLQLSDTSPLDPTKYYCIPSGVSFNQMVRAVVKWLEDHPARLHEPAVLLIITSFKENFPCRQTNYGK